MCLKLFKSQQEMLLHPFFPTISGLIVDDLVGPAQGPCGVRVFGPSRNMRRAVVVRAHAAGVGRCGTA